MNRYLAAFSGGDDPRCFVEIVAPLLLDRAEVVVNVEDDETTGAHTAINADSLELVGPLFDPLGREFGRQVLPARTP